MFLLFLQTCIGTSRGCSWRWRWHWRGRKAYYGDIAHLCSLLHAVALQHLRADSNLDNLEPLGVPRNGDTSGLLTEISWDQFADESVAVCYSVYCFFNWVNTSSMDSGEYQHVGDDFPASHVWLSEASAHVQAV